MQKKVELMEQSALLLQGCLSSLDAQERLTLGGAGFSRREQRELRHQLYRIIGFIRAKSAGKPPSPKLDLRFDAKKRR